MKKVYSIIVVLMLVTAVRSQTMNVVSGNVIYQFPASQTGNITFSNGTTLMVMGKTFTIADIAEIYIDNTQVTDNAVTVSYNGSYAMVTVAGNVARYVDAEVSGAHVMLEQSADVDDSVGEITYTLSGSSADGEFYLSGSYKATVELNGLTLTNASGAPVNIQDGKRVDIIVKKDTENTLTDCTDGAHKACLLVKGHAEFQGKGILNIYGNTSHGVKTGDYMSLRNCTLNVLKAVGDGIHCNEYFLMESGTVSVSGVGDDGIQTELDGSTSTGETNGHKDEDSGNVYIENGTLSITVTAAAAKGVKASGDIVIAGGSVNVTTKGGGAYDSEAKDAKGCAGLSADSNITISGGDITLSSSGAGGKGLKCDGTLTVTGGNVSASVTGSKYSYGSYTASAKAIKAGTRTVSSSVRYNGPGGPGGGWGPGGGNNTNYTYSGGIVINGGTVTASASNHEAIESKSTIDINGGYVYAYSGDDAINSASTFTITDGFVMGNSSGNDGLDANGNFYIKGGTVFAVASRSPEVGIDANTEGGFKLTITGGTIVSIGGLESGSSISGGTAKQVSSYSKGSWYGLYSSNSLALAFKIPSNSTMGSSLVVYTTGTPTLKSGVTASGTSFWNGYGYTEAAGGSSVSLSNYSGGGGRW